MAAQKHHNRAPKIPLEDDPELAAEAEYLKAHPELAAVGKENGGGVVAGEGGDASKNQSGDNSIPSSPTKSNKPKHIYSRSRTNSKDDAEMVSSGGVVSVPRSQKNRRQPRSGADIRGQPKKAGGGGKYTWGLPGQIYEEPPYLDQNDPNYDSDAQGNITFEVSEGDIDDEDLTTLNDIFLEFFESADALEAVVCVLTRSCRELRLNEAGRIALVRVLINQSIDRSLSVRELTSELLAELVGRKVVFTCDVARGLNLLLINELNELELDSPTAAKSIGNFIARGIADMALSADYLDSLVKGKPGYASNAVRAIEHAEVMSKQSNRLEDIWGTGGAIRPVRALSRQMHLILEEYIGHQLIHEARECLHELEVPHFHHDLVFQAGIMSCEAMHERKSQALAELMAALFASGDLLQDAIDTGFERFYKELKELSLDVPAAYTLAERWVAACQTKGILKDDIAKKLPQKGGRRRFVSESDGGRLMCTDYPTHPIVGEK